MSEILLTIITVLLLAYIAYREAQFNRERQQLLDRIMAKDLVEFKSLQPEKETEEEKKEETQIPIEEAMEELLDEN
jgi:hypothetical protein